MSWQQDKGERERGVLGGKDGRKGSRQDKGGRERGVLGGKDGMKGSRRDKGGREGCKVREEGEWR